MSDRIDITDELMASLHEAGEILAGTKVPARRWAPPSAVDVKAIRGRSGLSQVAFAHRYGFSKDAVRDWEQGRRRPEQAARTLLLVIDLEPAAVARVLETPFGDNIWSQAGKTHCVHNRPCEHEERQTSPFLGGRRAAFATTTRTRKAAPAPTGAPRAVCSLPSGVE